MIIKPEMFYVYDECPIRKYEGRFFGGKYELIIKHYDKYTSYYIYAYYQKFNSPQEAEDALIQIKLAT